MHGSYWEEQMDTCVGHLYKRHIPQQSSFFYNLGEVQGLGPKTPGKQKSFPCSLAVTIAFHALFALTFCFSPAWFHSSGPTSSLWSFLLCISLSLSSPSPSCRSHSVKLSIPSLYFLAKSMGTFLLMFVTKGLSQFFCGHAYPKHFKCCVPHC